jgi:hypothetical protein
MKCDLAASMRLHGQLRRDCFVAGPVWSAATVGLDTCFAFETWALELIVTATKDVNNSKLKLTPKMCKCSVSSALVKPWGYKIELFPRLTRSYQAPRNAGVPQTQPMLLLCRRTPRHPSPTQAWFARLEGRRRPRGVAKAGGHWVWA